MRAFVVSVACASVFCASLLSTTAAAQLGPCSLSGDGDTWTGENWAQRPPPDGNPTLQYSTIGGCDGPARFCTRWVYDAAGRVVAQGDDDNCDGRFDDTCHGWAYNADGLMISDSQDTDCDGVDDGYCAAWTYDAEGRQVDQRYDPLCNGAPDRCLQRLCDASGNLVQERHLDGACAGELSCVTWTYNAAGRPLTRTDSCDGGPARHCDSWTYDEQGRETSYVHDWDCDGFPGRPPGLPGGWPWQHDSCSTTTYSDFESSSTFDDYCDGVPEVCGSIMSDTQGNVLVGRSDEGCDGDPECEAWTYDAVGHETVRGADTDCDGVPDSYCWNTDWDAEGRVVAEWLDETCDGIAEQCTVYDYSENPVPPMDMGGGGGDVGATADIGAAQDVGTSDMGTPDARFDEGSDHDGEPSSDGPSQARVAGGGGCCATTHGGGSGLLAIFVFASTVVRRRRPHRTSLLQAKRSKRT